jgi:hypothetical protein
VFPPCSSGVSLPWSQEFGAPEAVSVSSRFVMSGQEDFSSSVIQTLFHSSAADEEIRKKKRKPSVT